MTFPAPISAGPATVAFSGLTGLAWGVRRRAFGQTEALAAPVHIAAGADAKAWMAETG